MASRKRAKAPMSLTNTHYFTSTLALSLKVLYCHLPADIFVEAVLESVICKDLK